MTQPPMKTCKDCGEQKPLVDYHRKAQARDGRQNRCKSCAIAKVVQWQRDNPHRLRDKQRRSNLKRWYGLTPEDREAMLQRQGGCCAICGVPETAVKELAVDHCHATGRVRGLLCLLCNSALGRFKDDLAILAKAAAYLDH